MHDIRAMPVFALRAVPARAVLTPGHPGLPGGELQASGRVAIAVFAIVATCLAIFAAWGLAALRARRRAARARRRAAAD